MTNLEVIVFWAFGRRRIARNGIHIVYIAKESRSTSGKHLVRIALVANIENKLILWCIKNIMQSHGSLNKSEVRTYMASMFAHTI